MFASGRPNFSKYKDHGLDQIRRKDFICTQFIDINVKGLIC